MEGSVLSLPTKTERILVIALESTAARGNDWRGLAECVGFTPRQIQAIETCHGDSFTRRVLSTWDRSDKSSVKKLIIALILIKRVDCVRKLEEGLGLREEDMKELHQIAAELERSEDKRLALFPEFGEGDLEIFPPSPPSWMPPCRPIAVPQCPPTWERDPYQQSAQCSSTWDRELQQSASSPNEERPPSSDTQREATDISPSKNAVFISYYPDKYAEAQVGHLAHKLREYNFNVDYASERQMLDADFKMAAVQKARNLIVLCSPKYFEEDRDLFSLSQNSSRLSYTKPSLIGIDYKLLRNVFFKPGEDTRIICVALDQDSDRRIRHVPTTFHGRCIYLFPSETEGLLQCVADVPKYSAPPPSRGKLITPTLINYPDALKEWNAQVRNENQRSYSPKSSRSESVHRSPPKPQASAHSSRVKSQNKNKKTEKKFFLKKFLKN